MTKEFSICLDKDKDYYPGDIIKGNVQLNLNKSADIRFILLNLKGVIEAGGEKIVLIDKLEKLAMPQNGEKYTKFNSGKIYNFDFQFEIPKSDKKPLPSTTNIPKIANISYFLTATPKKPSFNFSHSLSPITKEIKFFDMINIDSEDYCRGINVNRDLGFTNGSKPTQWSLKASKSAFVRGETIQLESELNNFPPMEKSKGMKISFIRCVHKTNSTKMIHKSVLMHQSFDLSITEATSTQSVSIMFNIPSDIPVSIFPASGQLMSVSYVIQADLNTKGAKSVIKLKDQYNLEAAILIGTYTSPIKPAILPPTSYNRPSIDRCYSPMPTNNFNSYASETSSLRSMSTISLVEQRPPVKSFHAALGDTEVKPLTKLDQCNYDTNTYRRSYLSRSSIPNTPTSETYFNHRTVPRTPTSPLMMRYQPQSPSSPIDRSITPLPPITMNNSYNTISYMNRNSRNGAIMLQQTPLNPSIITVSSPHEIGPDDVINKGSNRDTKTIDYSPNDNEKMTYGNEDCEKSERPTLSPVPSLTRQSTVSTSSSGLTDGQNQHYNFLPGSFPINK